MAKKKKKKKDVNGDKVKYIPFGLYRRAIVKATPEERKELYKIKEKHRKGMIKKKVARKLGIAKPRYEKVLKRIGAYRIKKGRFKGTFFEKLAGRRR